ncbi:MAG: sialate O-acetylesterase [Erysipelotrichia bacterium]|jgi:hypothetical protein|nr:sialate O-acetylesterase [Erysipelotrichia bacterium]
MKKNIIIMALIGLCLSSTACSANKTPVDVVIMAGQSNMVGCSRFTYLNDSANSVKYQEYLDGYSGIRIAYDCLTKSSLDVYPEQNTSRGKFVKVMLGQGNADITFGPEVGMGETLSKTIYNNKIVLIKYACGASNLLDDWAAPTSGRINGLYDRFVRYVRAQIKVLQDDGFIPSIRAMCWMQGEGDSYPGYSTQYLTQLSYFVDDLRDELMEFCDGTEFAFIDAGISDSPLWVEYATINAAKEQFAAQNERNIYIDTIEHGLSTSSEPHEEPDLAHYDSASMIELGHLFAEALLPFLSTFSNE